MITLPTINSFIRFFHASPGSPAVDIYTDGNLVFKNVPYKKVSKYLPVGPGEMHIQIFPAGDNTTPLVDTNINIPPSERITIAIIGTFPNISLLPVMLSVAPTNTPQTLVRFAHLSPNTPKLDLIITDDIRITDIEYTQVSDFITINPGTYTLRLRLSGEEEILLTVTDNEFKEGQGYTINALGLLNENPPIEIVSYKDQIPFFDSEVKEKVVANTNFKIVFRYE